MVFSLLQLAPLLGFVAGLPVSSGPDSLSPTTGQPLVGSNSSSPQTNGTASAAAASNWWYPNVDHSTGAVRDYVPDLGDDYDYPVYIAVDSGDSQGLINALVSGGPNGNRDNMYLAGEPRTVYLAPGTYSLTETLYMDTDTIIIGDAVSPPTIQAASGFSGDYLIVAGQGDESADGGELHFSVGLKNVILDTTPNSGSTDFAALSWRVAQNSQLVGVQITMPSNTHTGISLGQGSSIQSGDVSFTNGAIGMHFNGHQQITMKNLMFDGCTIGIQVDNGFTANVFAPTFKNVGQSVVFNSGSAWLSVVDATSTNSGDFFTSNEGYPNFMLENIKKDTTNSNMVTVSGNVLVAGETSLGTYVYGNTYGATPVYQTSPSNVPLSRPTELAPSGSYPISTASQYPDATIDDVINLKDSAANGGFNLYGNNSVDESAALQGALNTAASAGKIAYLPFGIYRVFSTVTIPVGTKLVGNGWSTISGYGQTFSDESNPVPVVQVGASGDVGTADIQDIRFTVGQELPGAIILQVNMAGNNPGDVAIHNSLITVGGTRDTEIDCSSEANCRGAYNGLHLTSTSSAYIDNFWAWLADHDSDGSSGGIDIAAKGGVLVEATKGTWLAGLGSEHWWLYQLAYNGASNVFVSLFQSETNYHQGSSAAITPPGPFTPVASDPDFSWCTGDGAADCAMGAAQYFNGGSSIYSYGSASWNFNSDTQTNMNVINQAVTDLHLYGLTDHAATYLMRLPDGTSFGNGASGGDGFGGSWGSLAAEYSS